MTSIRGRSADSGLRLPRCGELSKTRAPYALPKDRIGRRVKLEIHHKHWIGKGGAVYDLDNLSIMTPKEHIHTHRKNRP